MQQTQIITAAAAGVAAEGLSPQEAKAEAEIAALLLVALAENAIMILMLVEDHLRLQGQLFAPSHTVDGPASPALLTSSVVSSSNSLGKNAGESSDILSSRRSSDIFTPTVNYCQCYWLDLAPFPFLFTRSSSFSLCISHTFFFSLFIFLLVMWFVHTAGLFLLVRSLK